MKKKVKGTVLFFMVFSLGLTTSIAMESSLNKDTFNKKLYTSMFKIAVNFISLNPQDRVIQRHIMPTLPDDSQVGSTAYLTTGIMSTFYLNVTSILDDPKEAIVTSDGMLKLNEFSPDNSKEIFSLYLIPALKKGDPDIVEALIEAGANSDVLKKLAKENAEDEFINHLINDYQEKQKNS